MTLTLSQLLAWDVAVLAEAADDVELVRRRAASAVLDLQNVQRHLGESWEGDAAVAAAAALSSGIAEGHRLDEALGLVRRP